MTPAAVDAVAVSVLVSLGEWTVRALAVGAVAALLLVVFRMKRAATRHAVWVVVLVAACVIPILGGLVPRVSLALPIDASSPAPMTAAERVRLDAPAPIVPLVTATPAPVAPVAIGPRPESISQSFSWPRLVLAIYAGVAGILLLRIGLGWMLAHRLRRRARRIQEPALLAAVLQAASRAGPQRAPDLVETPLTVVPMTLSALRPVIVLPVSWRTWSPATLHAALIHEVAHAARRDVLVQELSLLYRAVFWFNPLAWWLRNTLRNLAEDASDDAVLEDGGLDRAVYAEIVLGFFAVLKTDARRANWPALAMAQGRGGARRIDRILDWSPRGRSRRLSWLVASASIVLAPFAGLAATVQPTAETVSIPSVYSPWAPPLPLTPLDAPDLTLIESAPIVQAAQTPQTTSTPPERRVIRTDTVSMSVRVLDAQGRYVMDLTAADFKVFEDGVEQTIDVLVPFVAGRAMPTPAAATAAAADQAGRRLFVIFIDDANIERADFPGLVSALERIRDRMRDDDLVSIVSTGYSSIEVDPIYDRGHVRFNQAIAKLAAVDPSTPSPLQAGRDPYVVHTALRTARDAVKRAGQFQDVKKALIYISGGYELRLQVPVTDSANVLTANLISDIAELVRDSARSSVTVYSLNARLLTAGPDVMRASLRSLAENTGGFLIGDATELAAGLQKIGLGAPPPGVSYYLLGYSTTNHDLTKYVRKIEIRVARPGLTIDYRREYTLKR